MIYLLIVFATYGDTVGTLVLFVGFRRLDYLAVVSVTYNLPHKTFRVDGESFKVMYKFIVCFGYFNGRCYCHPNGATVTLQKFADLLDRKSKKPALRFVP